MYTLLRKEYLHLQNHLPEWEDLEEEGSYCEVGYDYELSLIPSNRLKRIALNSKKLKTIPKECSTIGDIVAYRDGQTHVKYVMIGGYVNDQSNYDIKVVSYASNIGKLLLYSIPGNEYQIDLPNGRTMSARILEVYKST